MAVAPTIGPALEQFGVLAGSTVTNTGPTTVSCEVGVSPGSSITGFFPPGTAESIHAGDALAAQAQVELTTAYDEAVAQSCQVNLTGQDLGGMILPPGVYCFDSSAQLTGVLTLNGNGVYIFKIGSTLTTASGSSVVLINGAQAGNVFWQVGSSATLGTTTSFVGNIFALTSITATTGATVNGRLLARNGAVTLDTNIITCPSATTPITSARRGRRNLGASASPVLCVNKFDNRGNAVLCSDTISVNGNFYMKISDDGNKCCYKLKN